MNIRGENFTEQGNIISADEVIVDFGEYHLTADHVEGDVNRELVATGNPRLTYRGQTVGGDAIHLFPTTRGYRVDNPHVALTPDFLQGRLISPLYVSGGALDGRRGGDIFGRNIDITTCDKPRPDYVLEARDVTVEPGKRAVLRKVTLYLWGHRIVTLPYVVIPLDQQSRRFRASHLPYVGRSVDEGWFVKSTFDYMLANRMPGLARFDLMQKKGIGLGADQAWNLLKAAGIFAIYAIPTGGPTKNLSGRFSDRQNIGGGQTLTLSNDFQQNSYLALPSSTTFNTQFGYTRQVGGYNTTLNLSRQSTDTGASSYSGASSSHSYAANFAQAMQFNPAVNATFNADYSRYATVTSPFTTTTSTGTTTSTPVSQLTQQLSTRLEVDDRAPNYLLQLVANKNIPVGKQTAQSFFSGLEKLPELTLSNYRFRGGPLAAVPIDFLLSYGKYSEGSFGNSGTPGTSSGPHTVATDRVVAGFDVTNAHVTLSRSTDLNVGGGFQQFLYGDQRFAQYILRDNTSLTQRFSRSSGINLAYTYQRPEGGSPFRFDQQGAIHTLTADIGFLDSRHVQLTARTGYDFANTSIGGVSRPWQQLTANLLIRPVPWARFQNLTSFDPNTGQVVASTEDIRLRGHNDFALDLVGRYDPHAQKFAQINSYLDLPIGSLWRVVLLLQYNGYLNRFESRNLQITRDLHCMEASLTYIDNPYGFTTDRQIFFQLRIKAFPLFQRFGVGQFGQAIDAGIGSPY